MITDPTDKLHHFETWIIFRTMIITLINLIIKIVIRMSNRVVKRSSRVGQMTKRGRTKWSHSRINTVKEGLMRLKLGKVSPKIRQM